MSVMDLTLAELVLNLEGRANLVHSWHADGGESFHSPGCEACEAVRKATAFATPPCNIKEKPT